MGTVGNRRGEARWGWEKVARLGWDRKPDEDSGGWEKGARWGRWGMGEGSKMITRPIRRTMRLSRSNIQGALRDRSMD